MLSTISLTACNGGGSSSNSNPSLSVNQQLAKSMNLPKTPLQLAVVKALQGNEDYVLNLSDAMFIAYGHTYEYELSTSDMKNGGEKIIKKGTFECKSPSACILNIGKEAQQYTTYTLSINEKGNLIGGNSFFYNSSELKVKDVDISPASTSNYLYTKLSSYISNIEGVELGLYKKSLSYKPGVSMNTIRYAYFLYLTEVNKMSSSEAINSMINTYKNCTQDSSQCSLDDKFINDPGAVDKALSAVTEVMQKYIKDKGDAKLAEAKKWFDENIKANLDKVIAAKDIIGGGVDIFFPGAGGKVKEGIDSVNKGIIGISDFYFNAMGVSDSQVALERLKVFNSNLEKVYTQSLPTMEDNVRSILVELQKQQKYVVFNNFYDDISVINNSYTAANNELNYDGISLSITDYLRTYHTINGLPFTDSSFSWIAKKGNTDSGIFDSVMQLERVKAINHITNAATIDSLSDAIRFALVLDKKEGVNVIEERKKYNQILISSLLKSIQALEQSMYLDNMALLITYGPYGQDWKGTINYAYTALGNISTTGSYEKDYAKMSNVYKIKKEKLTQEYYNLILAEKELVAKSALQTLEVEGKCNITSTDGLNTIGATCPKYENDGKGGIQTTYIKSNLDKPSLKCLTTNADGSGDVTTIAQIANLNGYLGCSVVANPVVLGSITNRINDFTLSMTNLPKEYNSIWINLNAPHINNRPIVFGNPFKPKQNLKLTKSNETSFSVQSYPDDLGNLIPTQTIMANSNSNMIIFNQQTKFVNAKNETYDFPKVSITLEKEIIGFNVPSVPNYDYTLAPSRESCKIGSIAVGMYRSGTAIGCASNDSIKESLGQLTQPFVSTAMNGSWKLSDGWQTMECPSGTVLTGTNYAGSSNNYYINGVYCARPTKPVQSSDCRDVWIYNGSDRGDYAMAYMGSAANQGTIKNGEYIKGIGVWYDYGKIGQKNDAAVLRACKI